MREGEGFLANEPLAGQGPKPIGEVLVPVRFARGPAVGRSVRPP